MKLSFEQIKEITLGTEYITEENERIQFHRFNKQEENFYAGGVLPVEYTTAGVRINFLTDSKTLKLKVFTKDAYVKHFCHDILVDGEKIGEICNFDSSHPIKYNGGYPIGDFTFGEFQKEFVLKKGRKEVCIIFPYSVISELCELCLDEGALLEPVKKKYKLITYGDSITHGAFASFPMNRYTAKIADDLEAEEICKAIGGEMFRPDLVSCATGEIPEYVTVAYGTNGVGCDFSDFISRCTRFFENLAAVYPNSKIFVISPLWRADCNTGENFKSLKNKEIFIKETVEKYSNMHFILGNSLVPHNRMCFADGNLHPGDEGFEYYYANLIKEIKSFLK